MTLFLLLTSILFASNNAEFIKVSREQFAEGYRWVEVGKSVPSGTPAIIIKANNREFIFYRLEK